MKNKFCNKHIQKDSAQRALPSTTFKKRNFKSGAGFTLTELLVVVAVLTLITGAISTAYLLSQQAYRVGENAAELIQNGRVVSERMVREIRQAREIVTELPEEELDPSAEVIFQDGHLSLIVEQDSVYGADVKTIILGSSASNQDAYYKKSFIKITGGVGVGQTREIIDYNGITKEATIRPNWDTIPDASSTYKIDTSYYYIRYFLDGLDVRRQVIVYYFSGDQNTYVVWDAIPPEGQVMESEVIQDYLIGEYVAELSFWGLGVINISIGLENKDKRIDLETKVFTRNI